jgi:DNA-binding MarR family transcriptional regulator
LKKEATTAKETVKGGEPVEAALTELLRLVPPVLAALKHAPPPPESVRRVFEQASLGPRHRPAVMAVALEGEMSVSRLAERIGLSLSTTSLLVGELSRAGLLERSEDDGDRRRTLVRLNSSYRDEASEWLAERLVPFRRTLERLSPRARADFLEGWRILEEESGGSLLDGA